MNEYLLEFRRLLSAGLSQPRAAVAASRGIPERILAVKYARALEAGATPAECSDHASNPLRAYFDSHLEGLGIWKWEHYFEAYHRHLARFVGTRVDMLEVGIFSGGSLGMWRSYFGDRSHVYGVDIEEACRVYESEHVSVFIGDQADRAFWRGFRAEVDGIDIVLDDGGHTPEQQRTTFEEMFPHLRPGGVYICEDIHGASNRFASYVASLTCELNEVREVNGSSTESEATALQRWVSSIHCYPYMVVVEKHRFPPTRLRAPRMGTQWQPFL